MFSQADAAAIESAALMLLVLIFGLGAAIGHWLL